MAQMRGNSRTSAGSRARDRRAKPRRRHAKQQRARATVDAILEGAARVLVRHGYARATTNRIAALAGTSIGTLYQYFRDKDAVFEALIRRELEVLVDRLASDCREPSGSLAGSLRRLLTTSFRLQRFGPEIYRQLEHVPKAMFRRIVAERGRHVTDLVRAVLEVHRGEIRVGDLDLAAFVVVAALEGIARNATPEVFDERLLAEAVTLCERYLTGGAGPDRAAVHASSGPSPPFRGRSRPTVP